MALTWLHKSDIEYLIHLTVVRCNMEYTFGLILYAWNVNRNQIFWHLLPFDRTSAAGRHMKYFCPESEWTEKLEEKNCSKLMLNEKYYIIEEQVS